MLTIFAVPKPFRGRIKLIQSNAIRSWAALRPMCQVMLMGDEEGVAELASELKITHIPRVRRNEYGTPLISSIFESSQMTSTNDLMCYVNADIILAGDFLSAVKRVTFRRFLIIGRRWDVDITQPVDFDNEAWEELLRDKISKEGKLHAPSGLDYFVFPRGQLRNLPDFAVGRAGWDNWMVYHALSQKIPVIDATGAITAVHQNHDYAHLPNGQAGAFTGAEARNNRLLLGAENSLCTRHANWLLTPVDVRRAVDLWHLYGRLEAVPVLHPRLRFLTWPKKTAIRLSMLIRRLLRKPV